MAVGIVEFSVEFRLAVVGVSISVSVSFSFMVLGHAAGRPHMVKCLTD